MSKQVSKNLFKFATFGFVLSETKNVEGTASLLVLFGLLRNALRFSVCFLLLFGFYGGFERPRYKIKIQGNIKRFIQKNVLVFKRKSHAFR
jgi:hypothetical protein